MSKNVKVNETTYEGVSVVQLPLSDGSGNAEFKDVDEITTPSGSVTITENGTHDVSAYAQAVVNVPTSGESGESSNDAEFLKAIIGWTNKKAISEDVHFVVPDGVTNIRSNAFAQMIKDSSSGLMYIDLPDTIEEIGDRAFSYNTRAVIGKLPSGLKKTNGQIFEWATNIFYPNTVIEIPESLETLGALTFYGYQYSADTITFKGKPNSIANNAIQSDKIKTINVPWAEGEVENAPWGATSATINYNYTGE